MGNQEPSWHLEEIGGTQEERNLPRMDLKTAVQRKAYYLVLDATDADLALVTG